MVKPGGRAVFLGYTAGQEACFTIPNLLARDVPLLPVNMMRRRPPRELEARLVGQFAAGELRVATDVFEVSQFGAAVGQLQAGGSAGRVVVRVASDRVVDPSGGHDAVGREIAVDGHDDGAVDAGIVHDLQPGLVLLLVERVPWTRVVNLPIGAKGEAEIAGVMVDVKDVHIAPLR